jgi:phosphatidylglycerol:prolipoprotein diacylglycerol transferase
MFGLAFVAAGLVLAHRLRELGKSPDLAYEIIFAALLGGVVGAKLWFVIEEGSLDELFSGTGLVWFGGAFGGAAAVLAWAKYRDMLDLRLLDLCAPALALGYAVGRIGCQLAGDGDYGIPSDLPWAMAYPNGTVPTTDQVHPTPVYETITMTLVALGLWSLRDRLRPGAVFALYLVCAGLERFLVEFVRTNEPVLGGLTQAQVLSIGIMIAGAVWLALLSRGGGLRLARPAPRPATA